MHDCLLMKKKSASLEQSLEDNKWQNVCCGAELKTTKKDTSIALMGGGYVAVDKWIAILLLCGNMPISLHTFLRMNVNILLMIVDVLLDKSE